MAEFGEAQDMSGPLAGRTGRLLPGARGLALTQGPPMPALLVAQVVDECSELREAINGLAKELGTPIEVPGLKTLQRCLDPVVAGAISEFSHQSKLLSDDQETLATHQRIGFLAQELRKYITTATDALRLLKSGQIGFSGALAGALDRSLMGLRTLAYPFLSQVRVGPGMAAPHQVISVADLLAELVRVTSVEAQSRGCRFRTEAVDADLAVRGDRNLLLAAIKNLLHSAFKFTKYGTEVRLTATAVGDHVHIEVRSHCGGLAPGNLDDLFRPFTPYGEGQSGIDLGPSISAPNRQGSHGSLSVRDLPGSGCIFCIRLPTHLRPTLP